jgi:hypothetical protein
MAIWIEEAIAAAGMLIFIASTFVLAMAGNALLA